MLAGMGSVVLAGVAAQEAMAAARMLRAPVRLWPVILAGVQTLGALVARIENDKAKARADAAARKG